MRIRIIKGRRATDRHGAADYLGRTVDRIKQLAAGRTTTGFPEPVDVEKAGRGVRARGEDGAKQGREWYALTDLDQYRRARLSRARVHSITLEGDPDEELAAPQFAAILDVQPATFRSWVRDSKDAWDAGHDGYLPRPDRTEKMKRGVRRFWRRATAQRFIDKRSGVTPGNIAADSDS